MTITATPCPQHAGFSQDCAECRRRALRVLDDVDKLAALLIAADAGTAATGTCLGLLATRAAAGLTAAEAAGIRAGLDAAARSWQDVRRLIGALIPGPRTGLSGKTRTRGHRFRCATHHCAR